MMATKHSGLGIASFIMSILVGLLLFVMFAIAGIMEASRPEGIDETSASAVVLGLFILGFLALAVVAFGLGIAGLCQKERKKVFAILGTIFSAVTVLGTILLLLIGSTM
jgi:hypothetical protein